MNNPVSKFSLKEWVRHPTTIMLFITVNVIWILIFMVTDMAKDSNRGCMEQVTYLRDRVEKLEKQVDAYTTTIMTLRGANTRLADSLASKGGI